MSIRELIFYLVQIALLFAFPTIFGWILKYIPWLASIFDPQTLFGIILSVVMYVVSWLLGLLRIYKVTTEYKKVLAQVNAKN